MILLVISDRLPTAQFIFALFHFSGMDFVFRSHGCFDYKLVGVPGDEVRPCHSAASRILCIPSGFHGRSVLASAEREEGEEQKARHGSAGGRM